MSPRNHSLTGRLLRTLLGLCLLITTSTGQAIERVTFYHNDALGSPVAATDANGTLLWRESYAPYGKRLTQEAGSKHTVWYTGKPEEAALGLSYFGARWYDPAIGRFMAMDPAGFDPDNIHSFGRYAYANDNPYKYLDPDGNSPLDIGFFIADSIKFAIAVNSGDTAAIQSAAADLAGSAIGLISPVPGTGQLIKGARAGSKLAKISKNTVGGLRSAGQKDAHHIIQDAAAKNIPGYKTNAAPGVQLSGPANRVGTPHYNATQVQRQRGTGTYASERRIGYKALRRGGLSRDEAKTQIGHADNYFGGLGVTGSTKMRPVGNRR